MRCVLHIGTEKTGTTALQSALSSQRKQLARAGVYYARSPGDFNCRSLVAAFTPLNIPDDYKLQHELTEQEKFARWRQSLLDEILNEINRVRGKHHTYVLSSEHFSSRVTTKEDVDALADYLRTGFDDIEVVCYLRRQDLMATSRINEGLRAGFSQRWFPKIKTDSGLPSLYNYQALIQRWSDAFGESTMRLRIFERPNLVGGDVLTDFSETQLGLRLTQGERGNSNASLSLTAQIALMMFNEAMGVKSRFHVAEHRRKLAKYLERVAPGEDGKPIRSQAFSFYKHFEEGNTYLAQQYFKRDRLFEESFDEYPEHELESDIESAASLLAGFYLNLFIE